MYYVFAFQVGSATGIFCGPGCGWHVSRHKPSWLLKDDGCSGKALSHTFTIVHTWEGFKSFPRIEIAESGLYGWEVANGHAACLAWSSNRTSGEHVSVNNTTIGGRMEIRVQKLLRMNLSFYTGTQKPLWRCPNISKNTQNQVVWTKNMFCKWTYIYHIS